MSDSDHRPIPRSEAPVTRHASSKGEIAAFLRKAQDVPVPFGQRNRLIFALDATMSRQPTWDRACALQAGMFEAAAAAGGLDIQLVYYRGLGECRAGRWAADARALGALMERIACRGGQTQLGRVLRHALNETTGHKVQALVFVGDALEEALDSLAAAAGQLGLRGTPAFMFQEGRDPRVEAGFREIARLSGGAYAQFGEDSAGRLARLLRAVAAFASGGRRALEAQADAEGLALLAQLR